MRSNSLLTKKSPGPDGVTTKIFQAFKELISVFNAPQTIPSNRQGRNATKLIYEIKITLIPKPDKVATKKENYTQMQIFSIKYSQTSSTTY
jgi:hypothetical protein